MAKEFKEYDKRYASLKGKCLHYEASSVEFWIEHADILRGWDAAVTRLAPEIYSTEAIRIAVYEASDADEWQKFRVSLKTMSTQQKLYRLAFRYKYFGYTSIERVRISNYLYAMKRGGLLDDNWQIRRN